MYIGTNDSGVYGYEGGKFFSYDSSELSMSVREICGSETVYAATTKGLFILTEDGKAELYGENYRGSYSDVAADDSGNIWLLSDSGALSRIGTTTKEIKLDTTYSLNCVEYADGKIFVGTYGDEIFIIEPTSGAVTKMTAPSLEVVNDFYMGTELYVVADNGLGIISYDEECGYFYSSLAEYFGGSSVENVFEDYEGNLWLASSREGLYKLTHGLFSHLSSTVGLGGETVNSTAMLGGVLYVGTDNGFHIIDGSTAVKNELTEMLSGIRIRCIIADSNDNLWICTYKNYGLLRYSPNSERLTVWTTADYTLPLTRIAYTVYPVLSTSKIRTAMELSDGRIAVGTSGAGILIIDGDNIAAEYSITEGMNNDVVLCIEADADGNIYAGTDGGGISRIDKNGKVSNFSVADGLKSDVILRITRDDNADGMWISCGSYLCFYDGTTFSYIDKFLATAGSIFEIRTVGDKLWIFRPTGVIETTAENLLSDEDFSYNLAGLADGLTSTITANSFSGEYDGKYYISTGDGVYIFEGFSNSTTVKPLKISLNSIIIEGNVYSDFSDLVIDKYAERITFDFSVLCFTDTDFEVYYYLEGYDTQEKVLTESSIRNIGYTNLSGGNYVLHMRVKNSEGTFGEEIRVSFVKEKRFIEHWYLHLLITVASCAALVGLFFLIVKIRMRAALRRENEYKEITREAFTTVAKAIDAKDHYTNGHSYRVALYSREIAKKIGFTDDEQERVYYTGLMHDIGKIGVPDYILNKPSKLSDEEFDVIKQHVVTGGEILSDMKAVPNIVDGAKYHHEKYNGKGYVNGICGCEIPLIARIICVADCFDAMNSARVYRPALTKQRIIEEFEKGRGTQFDPIICDIMLEMIKSDAIYLIATT